MIKTAKPQYLLQRSIILLTVIFFAFYVLYDLNLLNLIFESDRSKISILILAIYTAATFHWIYIARNLDSEIKGEGKVLDFLDAVKSKSSLESQSLSFHQVAKA